MQIGFAGSSDSARIRGVDSNKTLFVAGAGVNAQINDSFNVFANYDLEARKSYSAHSSQAGLEYAF